jgi:RNA polymerase sigma-70 factor (ECF subfamily)
VKGIEMDDRELLIQVKNKDQTAFANLVTRYQKKLINFTRRYVDFEDARDIVQNTFIKIYKNLNKIDINKKFSTYLFEIAKNEAISLHRKRKREVPLNEFIVDTGQLTTEDTGIRGAVEKLKDKYKQVIKLYYFDKLHYKQIAAILELPVNTIRTHLRRAKAALRRNKLL